MSVHAGPERIAFLGNYVLSLLHGDTLVIPYAISDHSTVIASVPLAPLIAALLASCPTGAQSF